MTSIRRTQAPNQPITFRAILERSDNRIWGCHIRIPGRIAEQFLDGGSRRVACRLDEGNEFQCGILPRGKSLFVITVNKKLRDALGLNFGDEVGVQLRKDESAYGLPLPEEMRELLKQDQKGSAFFHALSAGRQRTLLYIVAAVKSSPLRAARAVTVIRHLKANQGTINYKELYRQLKSPDH